MVRKSKTLAAYEQPGSRTRTAWLAHCRLALSLARFPLSVPRRKSLGLVGHDGVLPLGEYLPAARQGWGVAAYWRLPTLFWLDSSDTVLLAAAMIGVVLGYLSFVYAGQVFTNYQRDQLLLEAGFLAVFLTAGSRIVVWRSTPGFCNRLQ